MTKRGRRRRLALLAAAAAVAACCPSIWLTVTKRSAGPRPWLPLPTVAEPPVVEPPVVDNRFDVLQGGKLSKLYPAYRDTIDPRQDPVNAITEAKGALDELRGQQGVPGGTSFNFFTGETETHDATVTCNKAGKNCKAVVVKGHLKSSKPIAARITTRDDPPATFERVVQVCAPADGSAGPPEGCPTSGDTFLGFSSEFPAPKNRQVKIELAGSVQLSQPLFTFVHLSDVQIRDGDVKLGDADLSRRLDWLIQSFEYDDDQQLYGRYVVEALFATINTEVDTHAPDDPLRPAFIVHTGDAIDSGVSTELAVFHDLVDRLSIPFYDVIGNHDVLVFGNLMPSGEERDGSCMSAGSVAAPYLAYFKKKRWFLPTKLCVDAAVRCESCPDGEVQLVAHQDHETARRTFMDGFRHAPYAAVPQLGDEGTFTRQHGFDLNHGLGYYAFARAVPEPGRAGPPRKAWFVALDSDDLNPGEGGNAGRLRPDQLVWLKATLASVGANDLVFVMAHHGLGDIATDPPGALRDLLSSSKNVVAFLYGHHHQHGICREGGSCKKFWEIETGSIIEFPQEGRLVRLKLAGAGLAYLEVVTFGERLERTDDELGRALALGHRGAERDYCRTHDDVRCSEDLRVYRDDGLHTNARLFFKLPEFR